MADRFRAVGTVCGGGHRVAFDPFTAAAKAVLSSSSDFVEELLERAVVIAQRYDGGDPGVGMRQ